MAKTKVFFSGVIVALSILILVIVLFQLKPVVQSALPIGDPTMCDSNYKVCFTANANKAIPNPFTLKDMADFRPVILSDRQHSGGFLHYPGSVLKVDTEGLINYKGGVGRTKVLITNANKGGATTIAYPLQVDCGSIRKYEWRPDKAVWACETWGGLSATGRTTEIETHPIDKYTFLVKFNGACTPNSPDCKIGAKVSDADEYVTVNGYEGFRQTFNEGTATEFTMYTLFKDVPSSHGTNYVLYDRQVDTVALVIMEYNKEKIQDMMQNPDAYITQAHEDLTLFFRQFKYPTKCTTDWCRERYYKAIANMGYNTYEAYPLIDSFWRDYTATSPGAGYGGVWIWDSFFAAWAYVNNCNTAECADTAFDSLRILVANKYPSGQWAREVWYMAKGQGWQAPGGWSFAVDQMDKRFGGSSYSTEFYDELAGFHNWVRTTDTDHDNLFQWGGTNSGWDGSVRWESGKGTEAMDLNGWMILDAESLRNMATRLGKAADAAMWEQRRLDYVAAYQQLCSGSLCYDQSIANTKSDVLTNAMYFGMLGGAVSQQKAEEMADEVYNVNTLGTLRDDKMGVLPTVARNNAKFCPCASGCPVWSGTVWVNINGVAYLGMLRYDLNTEAEYVRQGTLALLEKGGAGFESYCSADTSTKQVGDRAVNFGGMNYVWSDAVNMIMNVPVEFDFSQPDVEPPPPNCNEGATRQCGSDVGECSVGIETCNNNVWGACTGSVEPVREAFDQLDNDCDGAVDEDFTDGCPNVWDVSCYTGWDSFKFTEFINFLTNLFLSLFSG